MAARKKKATGRKRSGHRKENEARRDSREIDRLATRAPKSKWMERSTSAAGDPLTEAEKRGHDLLGRESERNDALPGVSGVPPDLSGGERRAPERNDGP